jgi:hypothetical protein
MDDEWFRRIVQDEFNNNLPERYLITYKPPGKLLKKFEETGRVVSKLPQGRPGILEDVRQIAVAKARGCSKKSVTSVPGVKASHGASTLNIYKAVHLQPRIKVLKFINPSFLELIQGNMLLYLKYGLWTYYRKLCTINVKINKMLCLINPGFSDKRYRIAETNKNVTNLCSNYKNNIKID